jgi:hypothetical protein
MYDAGDRAGNRRGRECAAVVARRAGNRLRTLQNATSAANPMTLSFCQARSIARRTGPV